jgi:CubicO group peptidase (beta-lactamase class C family)
MMASSLGGEMMRTMLKCALAVALMITASGLSGAARLAERQTHQASAAAQTTPDRSRMEEVIQAYASDKRFMGCVLVVRRNDVRPNNCYGFANLEWDIPSTPSGKFRLGSLHRAIHGCVNTSAGRTRQAEGG